VQEIGNPYISVARATMTRKALDADAEIIVYLDYDLSWRPEDLLKLIQTEGDVVTGTYRFKTNDEEKYMGSLLVDDDDRPIVRPDGCVLAVGAPAGFLKVTRDGIRAIMRAYPELVYGEPEKPCVDLFNHGAYNGTWWGEDYAFCRRWREMGNDLWLIPDLNIDHHTPSMVFKGNYHNFLLAQVGGSDYADSDSINKFKENVMKKVKSTKKKSFDTKTEYAPIPKIKIGNTANKGKKK